MTSTGPHTLDLHGMTWPEAHDAFIEFYNHSALQTAGLTGARLDVVHGYGSTGAGGVLRARLRAFLERQKPRLDFQPGENVDGNPGHTIVVPILPLASPGEELEEEVWAFCQRPRSLSKLVGQFRRHGEPAVRRAIEALERRHRLRTVPGKGPLKLYQAA